MPAWLLLIINPLNWLKVASAVKAAVDVIKVIFEAAKLWLEKRQAGEQKDGIQAAADQLKKANEIKDDATRLKEKADALCKIEKISNPDSDCDVQLGSQVHAHESGSAETQAPR